MGGALVSLDLMASNTSRNVISNPLDPIPQRPSFSSLIFLPVDSEQGANWMARSPRRADGRLAAGRWSARGSMGPAALPGQPAAVSHPGRRADRRLSNLCDAWLQYSKGVASYTRTRPTAPSVTYCREGPLPTGTAWPTAAWRRCRKRRCRPRGAIHGYSFPSRPQCTQCAKLGQSAQRTPSSRDQTPPA